MSAAVYIGDEVGACGYRLAGLETCVPGPANLLSQINAVCERAPLVLLSSEFANQLDKAELQRLLARPHSPLVVVPDIRERHPLADLSRELRQQLGVLE